MSLEIRIFLGYRQNKQMKLHLNQSLLWKEAKLGSIGKDSTTLIETRWRDNDYIGLFIPALLTCTQIKEIEKNMKIQLQTYCPKIDLDKHTAYLFSQIFLM